jgi:hypothetical protein
MCVPLELFVDGSCHGAAKVSESRDQQFLKFPKVTEVGCSWVPKKERRNLLCASF